MRIKFTSDSTCDLTPAQIRAHEIYLFPQVVQMGDRIFRDRVDVTPDDIYAHVDAGGAMPVTAAVNPAEYTEVFARFSPEYDAVIHMTNSSALSCCYQNALLVAPEFDNVYVVDSLNFSIGQALLMLRGLDLAAEGMAPAEIAARMQEETAKVDGSFILNQLTYLVKSGRCSSLAALGANLLKLKPCIEMKDGKLEVAKKYRGSYEKCVTQYITDRLGGREDVDLTRVFVAHSGLPQDQIDLAVNLVRELQPFREVIVTRAGCTISSHCGPGTLSVMFMTK